MSNNNVETTKLQIEFDYIKGDLKEIKAILKEIQTDHVTLRNDVNQANSRATDNKVKIGSVNKRIDILEGRLDGVESNINRRTAIEEFVKWVIGLIGISGVGAILVALINSTN